MIQCTNYVNDMGSHNVCTLYVPKLFYIGLMMAVVQPKHEAM